MSNGTDEETLKRRVAIELALSMIPSGFAQDSIQDLEFVSKWGINVDATISLGASGPSFERAAFYSAIRSLYSFPDHAESLSDRSGKTFQLKLASASRTLEVIGPDGRILIDDFLPLSPSMEDRSFWLNKVSADLDLEGSYREMLSQILLEPLDDNAFEVLRVELSLFSGWRFSQILNSFRMGQVTVEDLVPREDEYYRRLVGGGVCQNSRDYVLTELSEKVVELLSLRTVSGLVRALELGTIGSVSDCIDVDLLPVQVVVDAFKIVASSGGVVSRTAALEVLMRAPRRELLDAIDGLVSDIVPVNLNEDGGVALFSSIAMLVAGEMARCGVLKGKPPFFRRQAVLVQTGLICRAVLQSGQEVRGVISWAQGLIPLARYFYIQGLLDMRVEPRWLPDLLDVSQLRAELVGRCFNAARKFEQVLPEELRRYFLGPEAILSGVVPLALTMLPGPLEGDVVSTNVPPEEFIDEVKRSLNAEILQADSFSSLVTLALIFELPTDIPELAATALWRVKFLVYETRDSDQALALMRKLAIVAAVSRSTKLAEALKVLARVFRRRAVGESFRQQELQVCLISSAAYMDSLASAGFVGEWLKEISFQEKDRAEGARLLEWIELIGGLDLEIRRSCGPAGAALKLYLRTPQSSAS